MNSNFQIPNELQAVDELWLKFSQRFIFHTLFSIFISCVIVKSADWSGRRSRLHSMWVNSQLFFRSFVFQSWPHIRTATSNMRYTRWMFRSKSNRRCVRTGAGWNDSNALRQRQYDMNVMFHFCFNAAFSGRKSQSFHLVIIRMGTISPSILLAFSCVFHNYTSQISCSIKLHLPCFANARVLVLVRLCAGCRHITAMPFGCHRISK